MVAFAANAGSGKAILPHWAASANDGNRTYIVASNITDHTLDVAFKFYGEDGTIVSSSNLSYKNFVNGTLGPNQTGLVYVLTPSSNIGYAVIEWKNVDGDDDAIGLVAHGFRYSGSYWTYGIPVNNGLPF